MSDTELLYPLGEDARLAECVLEPLRRPGAVQTHGVLFVLDDRTRVVEVSESVEAVLGLAAVDVLSRPLASIVGKRSVGEFIEVADLAPGATNPVPTRIGDLDFDAIIHRSDGRVVVELEPARPDVDRAATAAVFTAVHRLARRTTPESLWAETAKTVSEITGFDRVMVYHFHEDDHGQVVGEVAHPDMDPYLGLHYPASDIPAQARELYLTKLSRAIVSSADNGSALLSADDGSSAASTTDLGQAELRSVSPHHLQFMRNMGQASTLSFSLVHDGALIGMITCAHRTAHRVPYIVRQGLEVLAGQVALQLSSMAEIEKLRRQVEFQGIRSRLIDGLTDGDGLTDSLLRGATTLLTLVPADGVTFVIDGEASSLGRVPDNAGLLRASHALRTLTPGRRLTTEALGETAPALAALLPNVAGIVMVPVGGGDDFLAWFRGEVAQSVDWLGDMAPSNRATPLSPRNSFTSWTQSVSGRSLPWNGLDRQAEEFSRDLNGWLLQRAESKLADLAMTDVLTGLPNRRHFMDRLEHGLTKYARGEELSLLFLDIDDFKSVNDDFGHDAGDLLLIHVAAQLRASTRDQDTVARLGGDEFVILCENTTAEEANIVAQRILVSLRVPIELAEAKVAVTGSIGIASANFTWSAAELLRQADEAMYRAKNRGRDRAAR